MKINKAKYKEDCNPGIFIDKGKFNHLLEISKIRYLNKLSSIDLFKKVFGKQQVCKQYTNKNWIWTFTDDNERLVINCLVSKEGISWESSEKDKNLIDPLFQEIVQSILIGME
jgi:hypothetical protein